MKLWKVAPLDREKAKQIEHENQIPPLIAMLLQIRGFSSRDEVQDFLSNNSVIADPLEIKDMDKASERVRQAIDSGELICVYGDYDADGVTSTALLYSYLETVGANVTYYIPSRETEGYGMNKAAVDLLAEKGVKLIVTVDNGIAAKEEIARAKELGIDTVVTDHHMPLSELPDAVAVVDLHRKDCPSKFKSLSGVGVVFKLIMALEGEYCDTDMLLDNYADILSLGTIGDIVDLRGENRVFVKRGTAGRVSFTLVPRINAVGRLGSSGRSVSLLLTEDYDEAVEIAQTMTDDNTERREIENSIVSQIDEMIRDNPALARDSVIVLDGEGWHQGVVGIVASRVKEAFGKPAIVISRDGENAKGSGRSVEGFPLCDAIAACDELLTHYGGHPMAAGLSLESKNIELFRKRINEYAAGFQKMPYDTLNIDCKLNPAYLDLTAISELECMQPYGAGNPTPVFGFYNMTIDNIIPVGNNKHLRVLLSRNGAGIAAMYFFVSERILNANRAFETFISGRELPQSVLKRLLPERDDFAAVYRYLRNNGGYRYPIDTLPHRLGGKINFGRIRVILEAMKQLSLINYTEGMGISSITLNPTSGKVSLEAAPVIKALKEAIQ